MENEIRQYNGIQDEFDGCRKDLEKPLNQETLIYYDNKKLKYKGQLKNGLYEGRGILYKDNDNNDIIYIGYFKNGKYNGFGKLYEDGKLSYEGFFLNNKYEGEGILFRNNTKIYEGYFHEDSYKGIGIEYKKDGKRKRKGLYSHGEIKDESFGILYNEDEKEIYFGLLKENGNPKE